MGFALGDEVFHQKLSDTPATVEVVDINAYFRYPPVHRPAGIGAKGGPAQEAAFLGGCQAAAIQHFIVPPGPFRGLGFESGIAGGDALFVDVADGRPVGWGKVSNDDAFHCFWVTIHEV